jgi:hypothetical protein
MADVADRVVRKVYPTFKIKMDDGTFKKLRKGVIFYVTTNRPFRNDVPGIILDGREIKEIPKNKDYRWCWQYKIGDNGKLLGGVYNGIPMTGWIWSGSTYNIYIKNYESYIKSWHDNNNLTPDDLSRMTAVDSTLWKADVKDRPNRCFAPVLISGKREQVIDLMQRSTRKIFLGVRFNLQQFNILSGGSSRKQNLRIAADDWEDSTGAEDLHGLSDPVFNAYDESNEAYQPNAMKVDGRSSDSTIRYICDILSDHFIKFQGELQSDNNDSSHESSLNNLITKGLGIHIERDRIFIDNNELHNFEPDLLQIETNIVPVEKMGLKINLYIKGKVNGERPDAYWEFKEDGKIEKTNSSGFENAARMKEPDSVKPGLQQIHILLEQQGTQQDSFVLKKAYCDGDIIFSS